MKKFSVAGKMKELACLLTISVVTQVPGLMLGIVD